MEVLQPLLLIGLLLALLATGLWVALSLLAVGIAGMWLFSPAPIGDSMALTMWSSISAWPLTAMPLFIWMGEILFRTRISDELFTGLAPWMNRIPGRLLHANIFGCAIFAAVSGSSVATMATVGRFSLPELQRRQYPEQMAIGTLTGSGTLGLIIPPSIVLIVYGVAAQVSIAQLFIGGVLPGIMIACLFSGYVIAWALLHPSRIPQAEPVRSLASKLRAITSLAPTVLLIAAIMGSIYAGIATPTEAAAVGVAGALLLSFWQRTLRWPAFRDSIAGAVRTTSMIMFIMSAAAFLTLSMGFTGIPSQIARWVTGLGLESFSLLLVLLVLYIILGCFLDGISIVLLTVAIVLPTVQQAGIDLLWFGIFVVITVEMAMITPPVGFNLFAMQSIAGRDLFTVVRASIPFFFLLLAAILILMLLPEIVTYLPSRIYMR